MASTEAELKRWQDKLFRCFVEDDDGNISIRTTKTLELASDEELIIKDHRGFTVFKVDENGDVWHKGSMRKIQ